jgi:hypothetical protein
VVMVMYTHNPSTGEAEAGGSNAWGQPGTHIEAEEIVEETGTLY